MNFSSYFPDWKGKYGSEINNELCFFYYSCQSCISWKRTLGVLIQQRYFDDTEMVWPKQVQFLLYKTTRDVMNSMYGKVTTLLYPRNDPIYLPSFIQNSLDSFVIQTFPSLQPSNLCVLHRPQRVLLTLIQRWWPVHLNFSCTNPVNTIIRLKRPGWEMQLSWSLFLSQGNKTVTIYFLPCTISMGSFPPPCASISLR